MTERAELALECARRAIAWARKATPNSATDWPSAAIAEAENALAEIAKLEGRVARASMGEALGECLAIMREARDLAARRMSARSDDLVHEQTTEVQP